MQFANLEVHSEYVVPYLSFDLLKKITDGFSKERLIGHGGFGAVYKGVFAGGESVAVRKLNSFIGIDDELFENECANLVKVKHKNVVQLLGYSYEKEQEFLHYNGRHVVAFKTTRAMCFEYMQNKSLDHHISDVSYGLEWKTRYALIKGICEGLEYLHESSNIHLNLKPSNILLDQNMIPKIADFGMSRIFGEENAKRRRTIEYMSPEFIERQVISTKCDIFSLGVIVIKLITGETFYFDHADISHKNFIELALEKWRDRLQKGMNGTSAERSCQQVRKCLEIALKCVDYDRHERPSIREIIHMLNQTETLILEEVRVVQKWFKPFHDERGLVSPRNCNDGNVLTLKI